MDTQNSRTIQRPKQGSNQTLYQRCTTAGKKNHKKRKFDQQACVLYVEGEWVHHSKKRKRTRVKISGKQQSDRPSHAQI